MAYMSKEQKAEIAILLKKAFDKSAKERGFSYTLSIRNYSAICMNIKKGSVDFFKEHKREEEIIERGHTSIQHNADSFGKEAKAILDKALKCLNLRNYNNSDIMTDYFDVGHYVEINIGNWDKPYILTK